MWTFATFVAKHIAFFEIYGIRTGKGGGHFADKRKEVSFLQYCEDVVYGRAPKWYFCIEVTQLLYFNDCAIVYLV